jgi:hypothetical protein
MPGALLSYHDGSLGDSEGQLLAFADGVVGGAPPVYQMPGELAAFHDGSLGQTEDDPISVWHDGVLGNRSSGMPGFGPSAAYQDGSLGAYARAIGAAAENLLDLGDANVMKELKTALAFMAPEMTLTPDGQKIFTSDWYTNGIWDPASSQLWQYIVSKTPAFSGKDVSQAIDSQTYPNGAGIGFVVGALAAPQSGTYGPDYVKKNMPALYAWFTAGGGTVLAPFLSLTDKTQGVRGTSSAVKMSTVAMYGLGAVALFGLALVFMKKR